MTSNNIQSRPAYVAISLTGSESINDSIVSGFVAKALTPRSENGFQQAPEGAVELAVIYAGKVTERLVLERSVWNELLKDGDLNEVKQDVASGGLLSSSLQAQLNIFVNEYEHGACKTTWTDTWSCGCDDECSKCGTPVSPVDSTPMRTLEEGDDAVWRFLEAEVLEVQAKAQPSMMRP